ncbi:MAG: DNA polymerase III subunit gamma/tau [Chloroflexi bacterium]|nr:DNA polymerase III subunit gamma/tau [Chloroflexota bacterium]
MSAEVWYRKWRPQTFAEVSGQEHVTRTLANAVAQERVAHAYLLCGPRGTGKTTTARVLAKAVNCANPTRGEPCTVCDSCRAVAEGRALDLVEMDAASNRGIDDIRSLRDRVGYHPSEGRYRVYLIDEVHELTAQAFDALLKTLEEPPAHIIFVLATTDAHRVPATIVSRCQRFDLTRIRHADIVARLDFIARREGLSIESGALDAIARAALGGLRDAINLLEQLVSSYGSSLTEAQARAGLGLIADDRARELAILAARADFTEGLGLITAVQDDGVDMRRFNREVVAELRALMLVKAGAEAGLEGYSAESLSELRSAAGPLDARRILRALRAFSGAEFRSEPQPSLPLELALADIVFGSEPEPARVRQTSTAAQSTATAMPAEASTPSPAPSAPQRPALAPLPGAAERAGSLAQRLSAPVEAARAPVPITSEISRSPTDPDLDAPRAGEADSRPAVADVPIPLNLEEARSRMRAIYEACQKVNKLTAALLNGLCDIVAIDDRTITFGFQYPVHAEKLLPGTQGYRVLSDAVGSVMGRRLEVQCIHAPDVTNRLRAHPPRPSHLLDEARKLGFTPLNGT